MLLFFLSRTVLPPTYFFFFFNDTATTEIYTLSLHDALPISVRIGAFKRLDAVDLGDFVARPFSIDPQDRKSTRLNSSHSQISYAVFCLKKKKPHSPALLIRHEYRGTKGTLHRAECLANTTTP